MKLTKSQTINENYSARIVRIKELNPHPNADKLVIAKIAQRDIIVGKNTKIGDIGVYCPLESVLLPSFISANNLYRHQNLNKDITAKGGFFEDSGRVKCVKLRGIASEGYWFDLKVLADYTEMPLEQLEKYENQSFDILPNGEQFIKKYVIYTKERVAKDKNGKAIKQESKLIDGQFRFHFSTNFFSDNLHKLQPESLLHITAKLHGTSVVIANVLTKKKLTWKDKVAKFFGVDVVESEYDTIVSSRTVVKNEFSSANGFYKEDIWTKWKDKISHKLEKGITVYGEIVGQQSNGSWIQKGYSYGLPDKTSELFIYRITQTNISGDVIELSWNAVKDYCDKYQLKHVPEYESLIYKTFIHSLIGEYPFTADATNGKFYQHLKDTYLEKMLPEGVPDEGICIRLDGGLTTNIYKMKSKLFYEAETKALDKGEVDLESSEGESDA